MTATQQSRSAQIHDGLDHPVIDCHGHMIDFVPALEEYVREFAGAKGVEWYRRSHRGATLTSSFLAQAVRERGVVSLEEAIYHLTLAPASYYGLKGRGSIAVGNWADIVMFDPATIGPQPEEARVDLPGDCGRMYAGADGVHMVMVNGVEVVRDGSFTGDLPGRVLRSGIDTDLVVARP